MKMKLTVTVLLIASVLMFGCGKEDTPDPQPPEGKPVQPEANGAENTIETVKKTVSDAGKSAVETMKKSFTMDVDMEKTVADLKAEASQMDIESLKQVAAKYKDAITSKNTELKALMDKLSEFSVAEKLSEEAMTVTKELKKLADVAAALEERFQVYVEALTEKGVDVKALLLRHLHHPRSYSSYADKKRRPPAQRLQYGKCSRKKAWQARASAADASFSASPEPGPLHRHRLRPRYPQSDPRSGRKPRNAAGHRERVHCPRFPG